MDIYHMQIIYIYMMKDYLTIIKNKILKFSIKLDIIMLNEIKQTQKNKYSCFPLHMEVQTYVYVYIYIYMRYKKSYRCQTILTYS